MTPPPPHPTQPQSSPAQPNATQPNPHPRPPAGALPALPPSLVSLDVGNNLGLEGDISGLELGGFRLVRLGNNSFTGGVPTSATTAR